MFRAVAAGLPAFRRDRPGDTFRGWLRGITRSVLLRHAEQAARQPQAAGGTAALQGLHAVADGATDDDPDPPAEVGALYRRGLDLVRGVFEPRTWQAFWEHAVDGRPVADVAAAHGLSPAAVRQAKYRALLRLRAEFAGLVE